jgi:PEP-CTERM motif
MSMRISLHSLFLAGLAVAIGLIASDAARAGSVPFTYTTTASTTTLTGTSQIGSGNTATLTETPVVSGSGEATSTPSPIPVATYTVTFATPPSSSDSFLFYDETITQDVTITDTTSGAKGTFVLTEAFFGILTGTNRNITPSISVSPLSNELNLGLNVYKAYYTQVTNNSNANLGTIQIGLEVTSVPEPSSLTLAGMGIAGALAVYSRRRGRSR